MKMDRPAAALRPRHEHVAAVFLQHAGGRPIRMAEHHVRHAAGEQARRGHDAFPRPAETRASRRSRRRGGGSIATSCRSRSGNSRVSRNDLGQPQQAEPLGDPRREEQLSHPLRIGKHAEQNPAMKPIVASSATRRRSAPSPRETARSACRIARPRGRPSRRPGNRGTVQDADGPRSTTRAAHRSPPA